MTSMAQLINIDPKIMKPVFQTNLFISEAELTRQPLIVANGLGVNSVAVLVEFSKRGIRPDAILFADTGSEKRETYDYLPTMQRWLKSVGFPPVTVVNYQPKSTIDHPPYSSLGENCLTNGTLPSLAFGFKSCSLKWKVLPQNIWTNQWAKAVDFWNSGGKVKKVIGYDCTPKDMKRYAHAQGVEDEKYENWYPLVEWGMDREACKKAILSAGLPVPPKSACFFCPATQPEELKTHKLEYLRYIVIMEARAMPKLEGCMNQEQLAEDFIRKHLLWEAKVRVARGNKQRQLMAREPKLKKLGKGCAGLWRSKTRNRPAMMTDYILSENLLPDHEVKSLQANVPKEIIKNQNAYREGADFLNWFDFLELFSPEDAIEELGHSCEECQIVTANTFKFNSFT